MTIADRIAARRPLWAIYPTRRLVALVLCLAVLWLIPRVGTGAALAALAIVGLAAGTDYLVLPGRRDLEVTRDVPLTLGLGDTVDAPIVITSHWRWQVNAAVSHELPATFRVAANDRTEIPARATVTVPV